MSSTEDAPPLVHALAGAVASIFSNTAVYPLDLITTRIQTQAKETDSIKSGDAGAGTEHREYTGVIDALVKVYDEEGVLALYRGLGADNASTMLSTFCYHFAYNTIREARLAAHARAAGGKRPRVLGMVEELTIGAGAGIVSRFVTSPASNVVTRSQTQAGSTADIVRSIYEEKGITGFWSGMKASVLLAANPSISYYLFELQKALLIPRARRGQPRAIEIFLMSATGKAIATLLLYPVILLKARTQATHARASLLAMVRKILRTEGARGLYSGALPQVAKGFLSQGILMLLKDKITTVIVAGYILLSRQLRLGEMSGIRKSPTSIASGSASDAGTQASAAAAQQGAKTGILAMPSQPDRSGNLYYVDSPRQDVNGLILATRDAVESAVERAVDAVGQAAADVRDAAQNAVDGVAEGVKNLTAASSDAHAAKDAAGKVKSAAAEVGDRALAAVCNAANDAESAMALSPGSHVPKLGGAAKAGVEWASQQQTPSSTGKVGSAAKAGVEWASQQRTTAEPSGSVAKPVADGAKAGVEWTSQTRHGKK